MELSLVTSAQDMQVYYVPTHDFFLGIHTMCQVKYYILFVVLLEAMFATSIQVASCLLKL